MHSLQVENGLSVAHASRFSHLHGEGFELQERVCPFPQVVEERRMEKGLGHDIEPSQVFLGHVQCGFGRQPHHHASRWGVLWIPRTQEKNDHQCHLCHRPARHTAYHVHACFGFSQRPSLHLRGTSGLVRRYLRTQACPYRGSFSMQAPVLTLHNSGGIAIGRRCSQTSPSISGEECAEMTSYLMNCFTRRDTALKEPMRGWTHTEACSTGSIPHKPVGRDGTISHLY